MPKTKDNVPDAWKPKPLPKKIGDCIDMVFDAYQARRAKQKEIDALEQEEKRVKEHIINTFKKADIDGARGERGSVSLSEKDVPKVEDWDQFYAHIKKTGDFDLLQRRPGEAACQERWQDGKEIPGVSKFHKVDVKLNEAK